MDSDTSVNMLGLRAIVRAFYVFPVMATLTFLTLGFYVGRGCGYESGYREGKADAEREDDDGGGIFPIFREGPDGYPGLGPDNQ